MQADIETLIAELRIPGGQSRQAKQLADTVRATLVAEYNDANPGSLRRGHIEKALAYIVRSCFSEDDHICVSPSEAADALETLLVHLAPIERYKQIGSKCQGSAKRSSEPTPIDKKSRPEFLDRSLQFIQNNNEAFADSWRSDVVKFKDPWEIAVGIVELLSMKESWSIWMTVNLDRQASREFESLLQRIQTQLFRIVRFQKAIESTKSKEKIARLMKLESWAGEYIVPFYLKFYRTIESIYSTFGWRFSAEKPSRFFMNEEAIEQRAGYAKECFEIVANHLPNNGDAFVASSPERLEDRCNKMAGIITWLMENNVRPGFYCGPLDAKADWMEMADGIEVVREFYNIPTIDDLERIPHFDARGGESLAVFDIDAILPAWRSACRLLGHPIPNIELSEIAETNTRFCPTAESVDKNQSDFPHNQSKKGVSLRDIANAMGYEDELAVKEVKRLLDTKKICAMPIGKCPNDKRVQLYRLSEILSDYEKIRPLKKQEKQRLRESLRKRQRIPTT